MADISSTISRLLENHDKDPKATAELLKELDPKSIDSSQAISYSWLLNHVLRELTHNWSDAYERQQQLALLPNVAPKVFLNYSVAAINAGKPLEAWETEARWFAAVTDLNEDDAQTIIRLNVLQYTASQSLGTASFDAVLKGILARTRSWQGPKTVAPMLASALSNIVSGWLEHTSPEASTPINKTMQEAAERAEEIWRTDGTWRTGGTWINFERACYLRALVGSHLSLWEQARDASLEGLKIIEDNGEEDVDKAFLLLELARAYHGLNETQKQTEARESAIAISKTFSEPGLDEWFNNKLKGT